MATLTVTTLNDDEFGGGDLATEIADGGGLSLREALALAQDGDTVTFDDAIAGGTISLANGQLTITQDDLTIDGDIDNNGTADITVDGNRLSRVFEVSAGDQADANDVTVDGLTITRGNGLDGDRGGGLLLNDHTNVVIRNSVITDNIAGNSGVGGGIYAIGTGISLEIDGTTISANQAWHGGGIATGGDLTIGGGSRIEFNNADHLGGGIIVSGGGQTSISDTTFQGNSAVGNGGAIYAIENTIDIGNSAFIGNSSQDYGGAISVSRGAGTVITNSTFYGNSAGIGGGAIRNYDVEVHLYSNTFTGNRADTGGAIYMEGAVNFMNNIVVGNDPDRVTPTDIYNASGNTFFSFGGNIFSDPDRAQTNVTDLYVADVSEVFNEAVINPYTGWLSGRLRDNGGPVQTVMINPNGPAHNGGNESVLPQDWRDLDGDMDSREILPVDGRGYNRLDGGLDVGAVELRLTNAATSGADELYGDAFDDTITGLAGNDTISAGAGADRVLGEEGADLIRGEEGNDTLIGGNGNDSLLGGDAEDKIFGDDGDDTLRGNDGNDKLFGGSGKDRMYGGEGSDSLFGNANADIQYGDNGDDAFRGYGGNDRLNGGDGDDSLLGHTGQDIIHGNDDNDILDAGEANDQLFGDDGNDTLFGRDGDDLLEGGTGNDLLTGNKGLDTLNGGLGDDTMVGNGGNDTFVFALGDGNDQIDAFTEGPGVRDVIQISGFGAAFDTFAEILAAATDDGNGNTVIDFGGGDSITLIGNLRADLDADDFVFM